MSIYDYYQFCYWCIVHFGFIFDFFSEAEELFWKEVRKVEVQLEKTEKLFMKELRKVEAALRKKEKKQPFESSIVDDSSVPDVLCEVSVKALILNKVPICQATIVNNEGTAQVVDTEEITIEDFFIINGQRSKLFCLI